MSNLVGHALMTLGLLAGSLAIAAPASATGAVRLTTGGCNVFDYNLDSVPADHYQTLLTPSGTTIVMCRTQISAPPDGRSLVLTHEFTDLDCVTIAGHTQQWRETISAGGQATLTCVLK